MGKPLAPIDVRAALPAPHAKHLAAVRAELAETCRDRAQATGRGHAIVLTMQPAGVDVAVLECTELAAMVRRHVHTHPGADAVAARLTRDAPPGEFFTVLVTPTGVHLGHMPLPRPRSLAARALAFVTGRMPGSAQ